MPTCSISLVSETYSTFGVLTACGDGAHSWPPTLGSELHGGGPGRFSLITSRAFPIDDSNWSIEDAVATQKPLYYDCSADVTGARAGTLVLGQGLC